MDQRVHSCDPVARGEVICSEEKHLGDLAAFTTELLEQISVGRTRLLPRLVVCINRVSEPGKALSEWLLGYGLDNCGIGLGDFVHIVQTSSVAHPISNQGTFPRDKTASPSSGAEVKNALSYTSNFAYAFMAWCLTKHRDNFTYRLPHCASTEGMVDSRFTWP
jgi:hypothetical protein